MEWRAGNHHHNRRKCWPFEWNKNGIFKQVKYLPSNEICIALIFISLLGSKRICVWKRKSVSYPSWVKKIWKSLTDSSWRGRVGQPLYRDQENVCLNRQILTIVWRIRRKLRDIYENLINQFRISTIWVFHYSFRDLRGDKIFNIIFIYSKLEISSFPERLLQFEVWIHYCCVNMPNIDNGPEMSSNLVIGSSQRQLHISCSLTNLYDSKLIQEYSDKKMSNSTSYDEIDISRSYVAVHCWWRDGEIPLCIITQWLEGCANEVKRLQQVW